MTTTTLTIDSARVWIGCLACYGDGRLVGEWVAAEAADEVTLDDIHANSGGIRLGCEEMWVMDSDGLPISREMSPDEAAEWGRLLVEVDEWQRDALIAWVRSGDYVAEGQTDLPSLSDFEERYAGEWNSFREYAENLADEIGLMAGVPDEIAGYFNWDAWTRDVAFDYTTCSASGGGVHVFRSL